MKADRTAVDADGHLEEVHINWKERVSDKYRAWLRSSVRQAIVICGLCWKASPGRNRVALASALADLTDVPIPAARA